MSRSLIRIPEKYFDYLNFPAGKDLPYHEWILADDKAIAFRRA